MATAIATNLDLLRRGGYLALAVGFDALRLETWLNYRLGDRVVHGTADGVGCSTGAVPGRASVRDLLAGLEDGVIAEVCRCFTFLLDNPAAPESLLEWAWDLTSGPTVACDTGAPNADRLHALRYLRGLDVVPEDRHQPLVDAVLRIGAERLAGLAASPGYRSEVAARARQEAPQHVMPRVVPTWLPGPDAVLAPQPGQSDADAYAALTAGPHLWHRVDASSYARVGYRWATDYDTAHQVARTPLVFWPLIFLTIGERFLCIDDGYAPADVAWAADRCRTDGRDVVDLLNALDVARTPHGA